MLINTRRLLYGAVGRVGITDRAQFRRQVAAELKVGPTDPSLWLVLSGTIYLRGHAMHAMLRGEGEGGGGGGAHSAGAAAGSGHSHHGGLPFKDTVSIVAAAGHPTNTTGAAVDSSSSSSSSSSLEMRAHGAAYFNRMANSDAAQGNPIAQAAMARRLQKMERMKALQAKGRGMLGGRSQSATQRKESGAEEVQAQAKEEGPGPISAPSTSSSSSSSCTLLSFPPLAVGDLLITDQRIESDDALAFNKNYASSSAVDASDGYSLGRLTVAVRTPRNRWVGLGALGPAVGRRHLGYADPLSAQSMLFGLSNALIERAMVAQQYHKDAAAAAARAAPSAGGEGIPPSPPPSVPAPPLSIVLVPTDGRLAEFRFGDNLERALGKCRTF